MDTNYTITASIERSLQNCSLNNRTHSNRNSSSDGNNNNSDSGQPRAGGVSRSTTTGFAENNIDFPNNTLELNSEIRLPYYWEQCLDLKTGEVYYINWRTGMKSQDDPRTMINIGGLICSEEEEEEEEDDNSGYDSEGSSAEESSPSSSSRTSRSEQFQCNAPSFRSRRRSESSNDNYKLPQQQQQQVLVVAGCKGCFMYFMVPKQVEDCPKCFGQLLHFDRSQNVSP